MKGVVYTLSSRRTLTAAISLVGVWLTLCRRFWEAWWTLGQPNPRWKEQHIIPPMLLLLALLFCVPTVRVMYVVPCRHVDPRKLFKQLCILQRFIYIITRIIDCTFDSTIVSENRINTFIFIFYLFLYIAPYLDRNFSIF